MNRKVFVFIESLLLPFVLSHLAASTTSGNVRPNNNRGTYPASNAFALHKETRCSYVLILVATYWFLEPVPIAVPALLPVFLYPILGIVGSSEVCVNYMKETVMLIFGGFIMAVAVEECKLHERIALKILLTIGTEIRWLMLGFMTATSFVSMWISITATVALMAPIAEAVLRKINTPIKRYKLLSGEILKNISDISLTESIQADNTENDDNENSEEKKLPESHTIRVALFLSICYAANLGGTGTIIGTATNMVFKGMLEDLYPESKEITFTSWMLYNIPGMVLCVLIGWIYLWTFHIRSLKYKPSKQDLFDIITKKYEGLGPITYHEAEVMILFFVLILLWVFRDPKFIPGWAQAVGYDKKIGDAVPAIFISFLVFFLPSDIRNIKSHPILEWKTVQRKLPWSVLLLVGGGFALADGAQKSGLSKLIGEYLGRLKVLPPSIVVAIMVFVSSMVTEIMTNVVTATVLLPSFSEMAIDLGVNPLLVMLPITIACSYAFMLPVGGPGNAISFESGHMKTMEMVKPGFIMNIACCIVQIFLLNTLGIALFDPYIFPSWANVTNNITNHNLVTAGNITLHKNSIMT